MNRQTSTILDASILYGAYRYSQQIYNKLDISDKEKKIINDKNLFFEFLHDLLLYEEIILDNSCNSLNTGDPVVSFINYINKSLKFELIKIKSLSQYKQPKIVIDSVCRIIKEIVPTCDFKNQIHIPYSYNENHYNYSIVSEIAHQYSIEDSLIPYVLFIFRGLFYSGFANSYFIKNKIPTTYIAAPSRILALQIILDEKDIQKLNYPKYSYLDLVHFLNLPDNGYIFSSFINSFMSHEISELALYLDDLSPTVALKETLKIRKSEKSKVVRNEWFDRLWSNSNSNIIGSTINQNINNSIIFGNVNLYVKASAI